MNSTLKVKLGVVSVGVALMACGASGQSVSLGGSVPAVGDGVQNLNYSTSDADNVDHPFVPSDVIGNDGTGLYKGQSFTTGSSILGAYSLSSISVRQVNWDSLWDFDGGSVTLRLFQIDTDDGFVYGSTELANETVAIPGSTAYSSGIPTTPMWLTFDLSAPQILSSGAQYAFAFGATGDTNNSEFFMTLDGTIGDTYAGGESITVDATTALWNAKGASAYGNHDNVSDRAFVATMVAVPEPSSLALFGLGGLGAWAFGMRRRPQA